MEQQEAYERRAWRLALLLSAGDEREADRLVRQAVWRRPDLASVEKHRLDRLVVLASRERRRSRAAPAEDTPPLLEPRAREILRRAASLPRQSYEAWILHSVDALDLIDASRAMDCSKTALGRHLERAKEALPPMLPELGGSADGAALAVRVAVDRIDAGPRLVPLRHIEQRRRLRRRVVRAALWLAGGGVLIAGAWIVVRAFSGDQ